MECPGKKLTDVLYYLTLSWELIPEEPSQREIREYIKNFDSESTVTELFEAEMDLYRRAQETSQFASRYENDSDLKQDLYKHIIACKDICLPEYRRIVHLYAEIPESVHNIGKRLGKRIGYGSEFVDKPIKFLEDANKELLNLPLELIL